MKIQLCGSTHQYEICYNVTYMYISPMNNDLTTVPVCDNFYGSNRDFKATEQI